MKQLLQNIQTGETSIVESQPKVVKLCSYFLKYLIGFDGNRENGY